MCVRQGVIRFTFFLLLLTLTSLSLFFYLFVHWLHRGTVNHFLSLCDRGKEGRLWLREEQGRGCRCLLCWYKTHHPSTSLRHHCQTGFSSATWYSLQTVKLLMYSLSCKCPVSLSVSVSLIIHSSHFLVFSLPCRLFYKLILTLGWCNIKVKKKKRRVSVSSTNVPVKHTMSVLFWGCCCMFSDLILSDCPNS